MPNDFDTSLEYYSHQVAAATRNAEAMRPAISSKVPPAAVAGIVSAHATATIAQARAAFLAKPDTPARLRRLIGLPVNEMLTEFEAIAKDPVFAPVRALASEPVIDWSDVDWEDWTSEGVADAVKSFVEKELEEAIPKSLTISVGVDGGIGLGVAGTISYALDIQTGTDMSLFITGMVAGEAGEDVEITLEAGLASSAPDALSGVSVGVAFAVTDGDGVAGSLMFGTNIDLEIAQDISSAIIKGEDNLVITDLFDAVGEIRVDFANWSVSVGEAVGESVDVDFGVSVSYVFFQSKLPNMVQPMGKNMCWVHSIKCFDTADTMGKDEINIHFWIDGGDTDFIFPYWSHYSISKSATSGEPDNTWYPNLPIRLDEKVKISIFQGSNLTSSPLGSFDLAYSDLEAAGGSVTKTIGAEDDDFWYHITVEIVPDGPTS